MSRRPAALSLVAATLALSGCVSSADHEALQTRLTACEQEKATALASVGPLTTRLEVDAQNLASIRSDVGAILPQVRSDFEQARERILAAVPEEVKRQVAGRLDRHFANTSATMTQMLAKSDELAAQLTRAEEALAALRRQSQAVEEKVDATREVVVDRNAGLSDRMAGQERLITAAAQSVVDFDAKRLACDGCLEKLKMRDRSRDEIVAFHRKLVEDLHAAARGPGAGT